MLFENIKIPSKSGDFAEQGTLKDFHKNVLTDDYDKFVENFGLPTDTFYEAISWIGLKNQNVKAWKDLSEERKKELDDEALKLGFLTNSICPN